MVYRFHKNNNKNINVKRQNSQLVELENVELGHLK